MMVIRARNNLGQWSTARQQIFYTYIIQSQTASKIKKSEYFIDTDPGFGLAVPIPVTTPGSDLSLSFNVNVAGFSQGFHMMVLRALDESGYWSTSRQQIFYIYKTTPANAANIKGFEYFIDNDPGIGEGTYVNVPTPANDVTVDFVVNLSGISSGIHILYLRAKDVEKRWSLTYAQAFSMTITGLNKEEVKPWFSIYPNPNKGNFRIEFADLKSGNVKMTINDMNGRIVYSNELEGENIPLSIELPAGIYMMTVKYGDQSFMQKVIIDK